MTPFDQRGPNRGPSNERRTHARHRRTLLDAAGRPRSPATDLLASWAPDVGPDDPLRDQLRCQLFTAIAGTVAEASARDAEHAVFMVHEFVTDQPELAENDAALSTFIDTVFPKTTLPGDEDLPWCIPITPPAAAECPPDLKLYLAKAVTNLAPRAPE